jgi:hypothetical protein
VLVISKTVEANIEKEKDKVVLVYPNPTKGEFKIEIELEEKEIATAEIYDNQARKLKSIDISNNTTPVDISEYANGVYFLKVYCIKENEEAETHEWKIVKQQ